MLKSDGTKYLCLFISGQDLCAFSNRWQIIGILSGYSADTMLAIECGTAIFTDATPVADVTDILNF